MVKTWALTAFAATGLLLGVVGGASADWDRHRSDGPAYRDSARVYPVRWNDRDNRYRSVDRERALARDDWRDRRDLREARELRHERIERERARARWRAERAREEREREERRELRDRDRRDRRYYYR